MTILAVTLQTDQSTWPVQPNARAQQLFTANILDFCFMLMQCIQFFISLSPFSGRSSVELLHDVGDALLDRNSTTGTILARARVVSYSCIEKHRFNFQRLLTPLCVVYSDHVLYSILTLAN